MKVLYVLSVAAAVLLFSGCSKAIDYLRDNPDEVIKQCQVQTLQVYSDNAGTVDIDYNSAGNPVDMLYYFFDSTGPGNPSATDNHFRYDKRNRLTDYLQNYVSGLFGRGREFRRHHLGPLFLSTFKYGCRFLFRIRRYADH